MPESSLVAAILLVAGPLVGAIPIANPSLMPIWSASREDHLATVRAHRVAWAAVKRKYIKSGDQWVPREPD